MSTCIAVVLDRIPDAIMRVGAKGAACFRRLCFIDRACRHGRRRYDAERSGLQRQWEEISARTLTDTSGRTQLKRELTHPHEGAKKVLL